MSEGHVYVAASGFGLRVIPKSAPYRYALATAPAELDVERSDGRSWLFARLIPDRDGYKSKVAQNTSALGDVVDVVEGPPWDRWWLETSVYQVPLPAGWIAMSANGPSLFDLVRPDGALIFVQTPSRVGSLSDIRTPDQQVVSTGADADSAWVELAYTHEQREWRQRHHLRRLGGVNLIVTAQAPTEAMPGAITTQAKLVGAARVRSA